MCPVSLARETPPRPFPPPFSPLPLQGVLICVDTPEPLTAALRRALAPTAELAPGRLDAGAWSKALVAGGALLWLPVRAEGRVVGYVCVCVFLRCMLKRRQRVF